MCRRQYVSVHVCMLVSRVSFAYTLSMGLLAEFCTPCISCHTAIGVQLQHGVDAVVAAVAELKHSL